MDQPFLTRQKMPAFLLILAALISFGFAPPLNMPQSEGSTGSAGATPSMGEFCPKGSSYDGANCYFGTAPAGSTAFIYDHSFYNSPLHADTRCPGGAYDGDNCFMRPVPSAYSPFIYHNSWYTKSNPHFLVESTSCPQGFSYDGANCYYATAPAGMTATVMLGRFYQHPNGKSFLSDTLIKTPPIGSSPFVYNNSWYVSPMPGASSAWFTKKSFKDPPNTALHVCRDDSPQRTWNLIWSDEFEDQPEGTRCYNTNDLLQCVFESYASSGNCGPTDWSAVGRQTWTTDQINTYGGLVNLNKCNWQVLDSFNSWDAGNPTNERTNSFRPENVTVQNGILKLVTAANPPEGGSYDCGRDIPNQGWGYTLHTKNCPFSGGFIQSPSGLPWTLNNNANSSDPTQRYVGKTIGYGRIEIRANITHAGQGMWPALWLYSDQKTDSTQGAGELDLLEYIADMDGASNQITSQSTSYAMAWQTAHNWGVASAGYPPTSQGVGIPISIGDWHVYAVEYEPTEIRFYIDGCLRNRLVEGEEVAQSDGSTRPFHIPKNQTYGILIGNPASAETYWPAWYSAWGGSSSAGIANFQSTAIEVDYIRYYVDSSIDQAIVKATSKSDRKIASVAKDLHPIFPDIFGHKKAPGAEPSKPWWKQIFEKWSF